MDLSALFGDGKAPPLHGSKLLTAAILIGLGNFLVVLDTTIANVSVPTIAGSLGVSSTQGTWVITSYAVAEAITVPLTGWLTRNSAARGCSSPAISASRPCRCFAACPPRWACCSSGACCWAWSAGRSCRSRRCCCCACSPRRRRRSAQCSGP